jgi:cytochrome c55X
MRSALIAILCLAALLSASVQAADVPPPTRRAELLNLLRHDCGSCHGLTLAGGLGLPLLPEALKGKSPDALRETILHGRGGTPMPPWRDFISAEEADWLVEHLMKGLPDAR